MNCYEFVLDLKKIIVCLIDTVNSNKIVPVVVGCPVLKKTLSYRVWVNGITHG